MRKSKKGDKNMTVDHGFRTSYPMSSQVLGDADPGVISEGESEDGFTVSISRTLIHLCLYNMNWKREECLPKRDSKGYRYKQK